MANFNRIPRKYFIGGIAALVVLLLVIDFVQPSNFLFKDKTDYQKQQEQAALERQEYADYLASIKPDPEASQLLFQNVIDIKEVEAKVAAELDTKQKINIPTVANSEITIAAKGGKNETINYFAQVGQIVNDLKNQIDPTAKSLFADSNSPSDYTKGLAAATVAVDKLHEVPVPPEAVAYHKAELVSLDNFRGLVSRAQNYAAGADTNPWANVYASYAVIDNERGSADAEFKNLDSKYNLASITLPYQLAGSEDAPLAVKLGLVKEAHAQFAVADVPQTVRYIADQLLGAAFSNFFTTFLPAFIEQLESSYKISNFLYYTDSLVSGQYLNDYLTKYVPDTLDQSLIRRFVPQISCANNQQDLSPIFEAKAKEFFNPNDVNPSDKSFYEQLGKAGNVSFSTPLGQKTLFQQYASGALSKSYDAALTELLNQNGLKVPRTTTGKAIEATIGSIAASLQSSVSARLNLGSYDPNSIVSKLVSKGLTAFESKFIFKGVVLKEQDTCITYPQLQPVIPGQLPDYDGPPPIF